MARQGRRSGFSTAKQISTCKNCGSGIYDKQSYLWQRDPRPGLIHVECIGLDPDSAAVVAPRRG